MIEALPIQTETPAYAFMTNRLGEQGMTLLDAHLEFAREDFKRVDVEYNSPDRDYRYGEGFVEVFDAVDLQLRELAETH